MDCPHLPEIEYGDFRARLRQKLAGQRIPISGSMELTFRCNLRCQHCYVAHGHTGLPGKQELSLAEIERILDEMVAEGTLWLLMTGGEPLLRRDFLEIYNAAKNRGLLVSLFTNATMITNRIADHLAEYRPFNLEISQYGATQETYERVTGIPGSYARFRSGVDLLLERKIPIRLKTVVMTLNQHELRDMEAFANNLGVRFRYDAMINAGLNGSGSPTDLRISPEEVVELDLADEDRLAGWRSFAEQYQDVQPDNRYLYVCGAGLQSFHIDPYGQLSVCMMARRQQYDLRRGTFREGWNDFLAEVRYQPPRGAYGCNQCPLLPICGQCPGWGDMEHNDPQKPVEYLCQVAHLRAEALGIIERIPS
jgi:radical SAM protein with 4Fe4S-binding SPASM domain